MWETKKKHKKERRAGPSKPNKFNHFEVSLSVLFLLVDSFFFFLNQVVAMARSNVRAV